MKNIKKISFTLLIAILVYHYGYSEKPVKDNSNKSGNSNKSVTAGCQVASAQTELDLNNVRTTILTGGDMWWNLGDARYEIPKGSGKHSLFAGAIWIGGVDVNGQLRLAAQKHRSNGNDYWTGPLITEGNAIASVTPDVCAEYDKHFTITKQQVAEFRAWSNADQETRNLDFQGYAIPNIILDWPGNGDIANGYDQYLAPFWDVNEDGFYNPYDGDYPYYDLDGKEKCGSSLEDRVVRLYGDMTLWWVYNDKGNIHTETTGAASIGMEFRAQAFAFSTNDELNNMTFYNYEIINRSTYTLLDTYFGIWTDADMGYAFDDFVGCDVNRGLGYLYNGDNDDEGANGYGLHPPAIGIDFFEGPYQDNDGFDNLSNWVDFEKSSLDCQNGYGKEYDDVDAPWIYRGEGDIFNGNINGLNFGDFKVDNERWGMRRYLYFNNGSCDNTCDPETAIHHYNYLKGIWKDGIGMTYGGTGYKSGGPLTDFMFPGDTDDCGWGTAGVFQAEWSEELEGNSPDDRRFVQSAGPFTLVPGAVNDITIGAVWARAEAGTPFEAVKEVQRADDKAQRLFENCFKMIDGPDAPELTIIEMNKKLIFHIWNKPSSNNYNDKPEDYADNDPFIICPSDDPNCDTKYRFQGYKVFQLKDATVSITDIYNIDLARLVFQCDIKDDVSQIVNYEWSNELGANIPIEEVNGANNGIVHTFEIENDYFAKSSRSLVNYKKYYYLAIAYSFNDFKHYDQNYPETTIDGQKKPYLASRKGTDGSIKVYETIPHPVNSLNGGTTVQADYGDGPKITRLEGWGNGYNALELTEESINEIMSGPPWKALTPTYENGHGPINVKVIDPLNIPDADFILAFIPDSVNNLKGHYNQKDGTNTTFHGLIMDIKWMLLKREKGSNVYSDTVFSESWIRYENEQIIPEWGISVSIEQIQFPGEQSEYNFLLDNGRILKSINNGFIEASMAYEDPSNPWLDFFEDQDGITPLNWIRAGTQTGEGNDPIDNGEDYAYIDRKAVYETIIQGKWAPYAITSKGSYGVAYNKSFSNIHFQQSRLTSVNIVITSDRDKWTRCPVIEMAEDNNLSEGNAERFDLRDAPSVDKDGNTDTVNIGLDMVDTNNPNFISSRGMGWFPGYAIDITSGERLNMMFGEDSWLVGQNGNDMKFNPTFHVYDLIYQLTNSVSGIPLIGGKHYIYVVGHSYDAEADSLITPLYDAGRTMYEMINNSKEKEIAWMNVIWAAIPYTNPNFDYLATDITVKLRTANPFFKAMGDFEADTLTMVNNNYPLYSFDLSDIATLVNMAEVLENSLEKINIVPNPYRGYSEYEGSQFENLVKITNLPQTCKISIYSINGTLVRRFNKDNNLAYVDWDLKNTYGISIASGVYIIHIDADGAGEKILKWFGSLRPIDLNAF